MNIRSALQILLIVMPVTGSMAQHLVADADFSGSGLEASSESVEEASAGSFNYIGRRAEHRQKAFIGLHGGWSGMLGSVNGQASSLTDHEKHLRRGMHAGAQALLFTPRGLGGGLKLTLHHSSAHTVMDWSDPISGRNMRMERSDDVLVTFIAPTLAGRLYSGNEQMIFLFDLSVGRLFYRNDAVSGDAYRLKGNTTGISYGFSMDRMISEHISIGIAASHFFGDLKLMTREADGVETLVPVNGPERPGVSRVDVSAGLKWHW